MPRSNTYRMIQIAAVAVATMVLGTMAAWAMQDDGYPHHFGEGHLPTGCVLDMSRDNPDNHCYHEKVLLNGLDSPQIDVAILVPVSPMAEREMRIMRQAVEAWEAGLDNLAERMEMQWLADGVDFHITVDAIDLTGDGGEFSTYPLYDPEIVIIASSPAGGLGIGIDPVDFSGQLLAIFGAEDQDDAPCHGVANPFDLSYWENLPGFDSHHDDRAGGTYVEDCGGAGGNVCFSVNGGLDAMPGDTDMFSLYDLVLHETGHCLTIGHVGDGADGDWGPVPTTDIMAYSYDPPGQNKCVSTLNVEGFALRMSKYLDVDGDGAVTEADELIANDPIGDGLNGFQVQHPSQYFHASSTGSAWDCPQPDLGIVPGPRTNFDPDVDETAARIRVLDVSSPTERETNDHGTFNVTGSVAELAHDAPTAYVGSATDAAGDARSLTGDLIGLDVEATPTDVVSVIFVDQLVPDTTLGSISGYGVSIGYAQFDTYVDARSPGVIQVRDHSMEAALPSDWAVWDHDANTITMTIPRSYLRAHQERAPYKVAAWSNYVVNNNWHFATDDRGPDEGFVEVDAPTADLTVSDPNLPQDNSVGSATVLDLLIGELPGEEVCAADADDADCPPTSREMVHVAVGGVRVSSVEVMSTFGRDPFAVELKVPVGTHEVTLTWECDGEVMGTATRTIIHTAAGSVVDGAPTPAAGTDDLPATGGGLAFGAVLAIAAATLRRRD